MNIVIPYRYDGNGGLELKYALRSIEKYFTGYNDIYLVGNKFPLWLTNVQTLHKDETALKTSKNILDKIQTYFNHFHDSELIQWQDDIYLTEHINAYSLPYYAEGDLRTAIIRHHGSYKTLIVNTAMKVTDSVPYYDVHTPIKYERNCFKHLYSYDWVQSKYLVKTLYCANYKPVTTPYRDCKIGQPTTYAEIKARINGCPFFSTSPQSINPDMVKVLNELYPNPSKYEN